MSEEQAEKVAEGILQFAEEIYALKVQAERERNPVPVLFDGDGNTPGVFES